MFVLADIPQRNFAPVTLKFGSQGETVALQTSPQGWGASFNDELKKKKKLRKSGLTTGFLPLYLPPFPNLGEEAETHWGLDESEPERRPSLIWRGKLGIEGAPPEIPHIPTEPSSN